MSVQACFLLLNLGISVEEDRGYMFMQLSLGRQIIYIFRKLKLVSHELVLNAF